MKRLLLALLFISTSASAITYEFEGKWQTLKNSDSATVCYSWSTTGCDVPAGKYTLHDWNNNTQKPIFIRAESGTVKEVCDFAFSNPGESCIAKCPAGQEIKRVRACYAEDPHQPALVGTNFSSNDNQLWCNVVLYSGPVKVIAEIGCE